MVSEVKQQYSRDLLELKDLIGPVAIAGFFVGGAYQTHATQENYKSQTQLTIFADNKASTVSAHSIRSLTRGLTLTKFCLASKEKLCGPRVPTDAQRRHCLCCQI